MISPIAEASRRVVVLIATPSSPQCPTAVAPFSPTKRPSAKRARSDAAMSSGVFPMAISLVMASPAASPAWKPYVPRRLDEQTPIRVTPVIGEKSGVMSHRAATGTARAASRARACARGVAGEVLGELSVPRIEYDGYGPVLAPKTTHRGPPVSHSH